jgi:hypothetical protein
MATRSRTSFQKRQKEILRLERQREKAAKRLQRKNAPKEDGNVEIADSEDSVEPEETAEEDSATTE